MSRPEERPDAPLRRFGDQTTPSWGYWLTGATAVLTAGAAWAQFGPEIAVVLLVAQLLGMTSLRRRRGQPCYTLDEQHLNHHVGTHRRRYAWQDLALPIRRKSIAFSDYIEARRKNKPRPLILPLDGLSEDERAELVEILVAIVRESRDVRARGEAAESRRIPACEIAQ